MDTATIVPSGGDTNRWLGSDDYFRGSRAQRAGVLPDRRMLGRGDRHETSFPSRRTVMGTSSSAVRKGSVQDVGR
jgi:hypothetical protein